MTRKKPFTITLPDYIASQLTADEAKLKIPRSTLIAHYIEQHYTQKSAAEYEEELKGLKADQEHRLQALQQQLQDLTQRYEQDNQALEKQYKINVHELQQLADSYATQLQEQALQQNATMQQQAADHDIVAKGLHNELELARTQTKNFEDKLATYTGIINDLKEDKAYLQKQLELITLRLPAPKEKRGWLRNPFRKSEVKQQNK